MAILDYNLGFEPHQQLNPKIWQGNRLLPDVESALIKIAQDFKKFIDVPFDVVDVRITGGQVSYFYTEKSDLDLHLIADMLNIFYFQYLMFLLILINPIYPDLFHKVLKDFFLLSVIYQN